MKTKNRKITTRQNTYNSKGITLIALVITIIVLMILAGVSINLVLGDNGLITKAKQARIETEQAKLNEEIETNELMEQWDDIVGGNAGTTTPTITINDLKVGDYIKYDTGVASVGTDGVITCRVLYETSSQYGLQIISNKTVGKIIKLDTFDAYNSAIETLNNEAEKYINTTYATDARCVGSIPAINENGIFTEKDTENAGPVELEFESTMEVANNMKGEDTNYVTDWTQMENAGISVAGNYYWLASRVVRSQASRCDFFMRCIASNGVWREVHVIRCS